MQFDRSPAVGHCLGAIAGLPGSQGETVPGIGVTRIGSDHKSEQGIRASQPSLSECYISEADFRVEIAGAQAVSLTKALACLSDRIGTKKRIALGHEGAGSWWARRLGHSGFPEARKGKRDDPRERYPV
jgi:hypothetical protein